MRASNPTDRPFNCAALRVTAAAFLIAPSLAHAYIGPGAGFAFLSSFLFIIAGALLALVVLLTFPVRLLIRRMSAKKVYSGASAGRVVIVGLDGFDPERARGYMKEGRLPNLSRLAGDGYFSALGTTNPPISPVAWSSFATGSNPGKHNIFDFLARNAATYLPRLSSAEISPSRRVLKIGRFRMPVGRPRVAMLRKSVPFWKILGDHGIRSTVLKVPITFPPEKFGGLLLSGLCAPDLKGSQGTFAFYTGGEPPARGYTGGYAVRLDGGGPVYATRISGPEDPFKKKGFMEIPMTVRVMKDEKKALIRAGGRRIVLKEGELSGWVPLTFRAGLTRISGIAYFFLKSLSPHLELYLSPIQIDPERPALPISQPLIYSVYLAKVLGPYATLGLPQDTWALNEGVLTDEAFLESAYRIQGEFERIFFHALGQMKRGLLCAVFDTTDAVQHEFLRYGGGRSSVIEDLYVRMDGLIGRVMAGLAPDDVLLVVSDHGFAPFRRGININTWLFENGYLALKGSARSCGEWFEGVDWSRTRAYSMGLAGIYLNIRGRESGGIVETGDVKLLKEEIIRKLTGLRDSEKGEVAIRAVYDAGRIFRGPYVENAPDLVFGCSPGYRASWDSVTGKVTGEVFSDNDRPWGADHCIDHTCVPGVIYCSRQMRERNPHIQDIAPTVLSIFGVSPPEQMDGRVLEIETLATGPSSVPGGL